MATLFLQTARLDLMLQSSEEVRRWVEGLAPAVREQISPVWLERALAVSADPWLHGFILVDRALGVVVGRAGFKGPPDAAGAVEVAYGVEREREGRGYATEAAAALTGHALGTGQVRVVRAHTLARDNASARVLGKCGFRLVGEVEDPEDGRVWRWEKVREMGEGTIQKGGEACPRQ